MVQKFSFRDGRAWATSFQGFYSFSKTASAGSGEQNDLLPRKIVTLQEHVDNGRRNVPPDGEAQQDRIISTDIGRYIRQRRPG